VSFFPSLAVVPNGPRSLARRTLLLAAAAVALLAASLCVAGPAGAVVSVVEGTKVGLAPRGTTLFDGGLTVGSGEGGEVEQEPLAQSFANNSGNPVMHASKIYAVYWDPTDHYHGDWQEVIDGYLHDVGADSNTLGNVFAVDAQYTDKSNVPAYDRPTFMGAYSDVDPYPTAGCADPQPLQENKAHNIGPITCVTASQVQEELTLFINEHALTKGMGTIYYLLTPPGVAVCLDEGGPTGHCSTFAPPTEEEEEEGEATSFEHSFCSYHSDINPGGLETGDENSVLYAVIPWSAGGTGDGQLMPADETFGFPCQNGGWGTLEGGIVTPEEPNQVECPSPDGFCDTGLADLIINQIAMQEQNTVTNPLLNAWQDSAGKEATDECRNFFLATLGGLARPAEEGGADAGSLYNQVVNGHHYYVNDAFNLAALRLNYPGVPCLPGAKLRPHFTAPSTVSAGEIVGFDGMESEITLNSATGFSAGGAPQANYATYSWNFGDGTPVISGFAPGAPPCVNPWLTPCAASEFHAYQYGGTYTVTLTVKDVGGNTAATTSPVTVVGPPAPSANGGGGGSTTTGSTGSQSGSGGSGSTPKVSLTPVAAAAAVSHSLKRVARSGLVVRYSVNEQVTGHFEVMLSSTVARRAGISGTLASGLPTGTAAQVVIAKALLVTTKAGRSTIVIKFSKRTAARLRHLGKVSLLLRLVVRNSPAHGSASATLLSKITLSH
jgi:hypothetical protein